MSLREVRSLTAKDASMLMESKSMLEGREVLVGVKVSEYPHTDKPNRKKYFNSIKRIAFPAKENDQVISTENIAKNLARTLGNGR